MPRPPKGGNRAPSSSSRGATSLPQHFDDAEEALEAGVEAEERGERAAIGEKALRNYEEAFGLYQTAMKMGKDNADATYNAARVLYLLGSSFYMPTKKAQAFEQSRALYQTALNSATAESTKRGDVTPSTFILDIAANLAAAVQSSAELCTDLPMDRSPEAVQSDVLVLTQQGVKLLEGVASEQERVLSSQLQDELAAINPFATLEQSNAAAAPPPVDPASEMDGAVESRYGSSLIVPSSLLELYGTLHSLWSNLVEHAKSRADITQTSEKMQGILSRAEDFVTRCNEANGWGSRMSPDDDWQQGVSQLSRASNEGKVAVLIALYDATMPQEAGSSSTEILTELVNTSQAQATMLKTMVASKDSMATTAASLPESRRRGYYQMQTDEILSTSDQAVSLARLLLRSARFLTSTAPEDATSSLRLAWSLLSAASQAYLLILSLLDTTSGKGVAAVLGSSQTATPTSLLRCQVLTNLSSLCLCRSNQFFTNVTNPAIVTEKSRRTILDNAKVYGKKALNEVGLQWLLTDDPKQALTMQQKNQLKTIPPGGWDAVQTQAEAILTLARVFGLRSRMSSTFAEPLVATAETEEGRKLAENVSKIVQSASALGSVGEGWALALSTQRFVDDFSEEEEGPQGTTRIDVGERQYWTEWSQITKV